MWNASPNWNCSHIFKAIVKQLESKKDVGGDLVDITNMY